MFKSVTAVFFAIVSMAITANAANLVRVYYPPGHYLGCGTPAADGSGIWSYDPKISEADCHRSVAPRPDVDVRLSAAQIRRYESLAKKVFSPVVTQGSPIYLSFDSTNVHSTAQAAVGVVFHTSDWFALDLGLTSGTGTVSQTSDQFDPTRGRPFATRTANFRVFTGD